MTARNNLASALQEAGDYRGAEAAYRQVLNGLTELHGEAHPLVAQVAENLGVLLTTLGRFDEAETRLRRSVAIHAAVYGFASSSSARTTRSWPRYSTTCPALRWQRSVGTKPSRASSEV